MSITDFAWLSVPAGCSVGSVCGEDCRKLAEQKVDIVLSSHLNQGNVSSIGLNLILFEEEN